jgi:hypothetical protein
MTMVLANSSAAVNASAQRHGRPVKMREKPYLHRQALAGLDTFR